MNENEIKEAIEASLETVTFEWLLTCVGDVARRTMEANRTNGNHRVANNQSLLTDAIEVARRIAQHMGE